MEFTIRIKDEGRLKFLLELLAQFDFVELDDKKLTSKKKKAEYDFFQSAGLFANREIDATELRKQAWRIPS
jgi:hypothetical protein